MAIVSVANIEAPESAGALVFNVTRAGDLSSAAAVDFFTVPHTAESNPAADFDFTSIQGTLEFAPGEALKQVTVGIQSDSRVEANEALLLKLTGPVNVTLDAAQAEAVGTIRDDDAIIVIGPDADYSATPTNKVHVHGVDGAPKYAPIEPYGPAWFGGVRVASGDINNDGVPDIITAAGPGGGPQVRIFDGATQAPLGSFLAYGSNFSGGVFVAAADIDDNDQVDIITAADAGGGPHVRVFNGATLQPMTGFFAFDGVFTGGVRVAAGDINGDGRAEIIAAQGPSATASLVHVYSHNPATNTWSNNYSFSPYASGAGLYVAAGDVNADGRDDLITGAGAGLQPIVRAFDASTLLQTPPGVYPTMAGEFMAYDPLFTGGVRVGAGDVNGDGVAEIVTGPGPGGGAHLRAFAANGTPVTGFFSPNTTFAGGIYVESQGSHARDHIQIIDNGPSVAGFQFNGAWAYAPDSGFSRDVHYTEAAGATATWTLGFVTPGRYRVAATWAAGSNRTAAAAYSINGAAPIYVDQRVQPAGLTDAGTTWQILGAPLEIAGGAVTVQLTNSSGGVVIADAVRLERIREYSAAELTLNDSPLSYPEGAGWVAIDAGLSLTDRDNIKLIAAGVQFLDGFVPGEDSLTFLPQPGIYSSYNSASGELSFNGQATVAAYQALLRSVQYRNSSQTPNTTPRVVRFTAFDGELGGTGFDDRTIHMTANESPTIIDAPGGGVVPVGGVFGPVPFTVSDAETAAGSLVVTAVSSNTALIPSENIVLGGSGTSRTVTVTPAAGQSGGATITLSVTDDVGQTSSSSFTLTVQPGNLAPIAAAQTLRVDAGMPRPFFLSGDDGDAGVDQPLTYTLVPGSGPQYGTIMSFDPATGSGTYVPYDGYLGPDSFDFYVTDQSTEAPGPLASAPATVSILIANGPTLGFIGSRFVTENESVSFQVTAADPDSPTLALSATGIPTGAAFDPITGWFSWTPGEAHGAGTYDVTFRVQDENGELFADEQTVSLHVREVNQSPTLRVFDAGNAEVLGDVWVAEGSLIELTFAAADADLPANGISFRLDDAPQGATIDSAGVLSWTPSEMHGPGSYSVTVRATDNGQPPLGVTHTLTIHVEESNQSPTQDALNTISAVEGTTVVIRASGQDADLPGNTLTYSLGAAAPANAWIDSATGVILYTPDEEAGGTSVSIPVLVDDGTTTVERTWVVNVSERNLRPLIGDLGWWTSWEFDEHGTAWVWFNETEFGPETPNHLLSFRIPVNDADVLAPNVPVQNVTFSPGSQPLPAGASIDAEGDFYWLLDPSHAGQTYNVTVRATDSAGGTDDYTFRVNVTYNRLSPTPTIQAPVALPRSFHAEHRHALAPHVPLTFTFEELMLHNSASRPIGYSDLTYGNPQHGTLTWHPATANLPAYFKYVPNIGFAGRDEFTYSFNDGTASNVATVELHVNNIEPSAVHDDFYLHGRSELNVAGTAGVLINDWDGEGDALSVALVTGQGPRHGTLTLNSDGSFVYTPELGFVGTDAFVYTVNETDAGLTEYSQGIESQWTSDAARYGIVRLHVAPLPTPDLDTDSNNNGTITENDDWLEMNSPGRLLGVNNDDDNGDGILDSDQNGIVSEDDLAELRVSVRDAAFADGGWLLSLQSAAENIKIWDSPTKDNLLNVDPLVGGAQWQPGQGYPSSVWVEGLAAGEAVLDLILTRTSDGRTAVDRVMMNVVGVDLDIDSDNDNGFTLPDRTPSEELREELEGDDSRPGKVLLVQDIDSDGDGLVNWADGFEWLNTLSLDDSSSGSTFAPVIFELIGNIPLNTALIHLSYGDSNPLSVISHDAPYQRPSDGALRLWTKNGSMSRKPSSASEGGDFVPSGWFTPQQLGLTGNTITLYAEAIRPSAMTGDQLITVRVFPLGSPDSFYFEDRVRLTITRIEIIADSHDGEGTFETNGFVGLGLPEPPSSPTTDGVAPGAYQTYTVNVYDPRQGLTHVTVDGASIPLINVGTHYASETFVTIDPSDTSILQFDEPLVATIDYERVFRYKGFFLPDDPNANPIPWDVIYDGQPAVVAQSSEILSVDTTALDTTYSAGLSFDGFWLPDADIVVDVRLRILSHRFDAADGAAKLLIGTGTHTWEIGIAPGALVTYTDSARIVINVPGLADGGFHVISFRRSATQPEGTILVDGIPIITHAGRTSGYEGLRWGDTGSETGGNVEYDYIDWSQPPTMEVEVFSVRPSDMVNGLAVVPLASTAPLVEYNPSQAKLKELLEEVAEADAIVKQFVEAVVDQMVTQGWTPAADNYDPFDSGAFGKEVDKRVTERIKGQWWGRPKQWGTGVLINNETKEIEAFDAPSGKVGFTQVDLMYFKDGYRPRQGDILDTSKIEVYEIKTSANGKIDPAQLARLKALKPDGEIKHVTVRVKYQQSTGTLVPNRRFAQTVRVLSLVGGGAFAAWSMVHSADAEPLLDELALKLHQARNARTPDLRIGFTQEAAVLLKKYLDEVTGGQTDKWTTLSVMGVFYDSLVRANDPQSYWLPDR